MHWSAMLISAPVQSPDPQLHMRLRAMDAWAILQAVRATHLLLGNTVTHVHETGWPNKDSPEKNGHTQ
jgi:hypothetical protein